MNVTFHHQDVQIECIIAATLFFVLILWWIAGKCRSRSNYIVLDNNIGMYWSPVGVNYEVTKLALLGASNVYQQAPPRRHRTTSFKAQASGAVLSNCFANCGAQFQSSMQAFDALVEKLVLVVQGFWVKLVGVWSSVVSAFVGFSQRTVHGVFSAFSKFFGLIGSIFRLVGSFFYFIVRGFFNIAFGVVAYCMGSFERTSEEQTYRPPQYRSVRRARSFELKVNEIEESFGEHYQDGILQREVGRTRVSGSFAGGAHLHGQAKSQLSFGHQKHSGYTGGLEIKGHPRTDETSDHEQEGKGEQLVNQNDMEKDTGELRQRNLATLAGFKGHHESAGSFKVEKGI